MKLLNRTQVKEKLGGASNRLIYQSIQKGALKPPLRIGKRSMWLEADVEEFLNERIAVRDSGGADPVADRARKAGAHRSTKQAAAKVVAA
jgi:predicted DNA-binding transcriptional regulator AlpA